MNEELKNKLLIYYKQMLRNYSGSKEKFITYNVDQDAINQKFEGLAEVLKEGISSYETANLQNTENLQEIENETTETTNNNETSNTGTTGNY